MSKTPEAFNGFLVPAASVAVDVSGVAVADENVPRLLSATLAKTDLRFF